MRCGTFVVGQSSCCMRTPPHSSLLYAAFGRREYHAAYDAYTQLLGAGTNSSAEALINRSLVACKLGISARQTSTCQPQETQSFLASSAAGCTAQASMRVHSMMLTLQ